MNKETKWGGNHPLKQPIQKESSKFYLCTSLKKKKKKKKKKKNRPSLPECSGGDLVKNIHALVEKVNKISRLKTP